MGGNTPKQFLLIRDKPILMHTLEAFRRYNPDIKLVLVISEHEHPRWQDLCQQYSFFLEHEVVAGGDNRSDSVRHGLDAIRSEHGLVAIHDGVRPLVSTEIIAKSFAEAEKQGNAVVSVPLKDSIRFDDGIENKALDRSQYRLIQTPQTFSLPLIREAYQKIGQLSLTDDASVLESAGHRIHLIDGDYRNIKITTQEDMLIAEALWK
jgi:2-C-methyl-D-erythritol 4-phosphate cytidylyltransferase